MWLIESGLAKVKFFHSEKIPRSAPAYAPKILSARYFEYKKSLLRLNFGG